MRWGNVKVVSITEVDGHIHIEGLDLPDDKDYKGT